MGSNPSSQRHHQQKQQKNQEEDPPPPSLQMTNQQQGSAAAGAVADGHPLHGASSISIPNPHESSENVHRDIIHHDDSPVDTSPASQRKESRAKAADADHALPIHASDAALDPRKPDQPPTSARGPAEPAKPPVSDSRDTLPGSGPIRNCTWEGEAVKQALSDPDLPTDPSLPFQNPADLVIVPTTFVFIFVNPNSGPRQGASLLDLDIYGFRPRSRPDVQVTICNLMDVEDRSKGLRYFHAMQLTRRIDIKRLHVWSAGGDGTFMWVIEELMKLKVDLQDRRLSFCTIPFGTGNDLSQVMGWGRSVVGDPAGDHMHRLDKIISERLDGEKARLDLWELEVTCRDGGYVQKAAKAGSASAEKHDHLLRKMSNYSSLGVQGFVGVGFEPHRHHSRMANVLEYARQSIRLVASGIPRIHTYCESLQWKGKTIVSNDRLAKLNRPQSDRDDAAIAKGDTRNHRKHKAVEVVVQNIPGLWGRHVDLWGTAKMAPSVVSNPEGPTDIKSWTSNKANDGKLEVFSIGNEFSYVKKQLGDWGRTSLSRIGQFPDELTLNLIEGSTTALMVDGEFYKLVNCKSVEWRHLIQVTVIGPDHQNSRMVRDSKEYFETHPCVPAVDPAYVPPISCVALSGEEAKEAATAAALGGPLPGALAVEPVGPAPTSVAAHPPAVPPTGPVQTVA
ncbi:hypothetical protein HKX48_002120 [Thoreauomyces humboldtii]|nr:hypothetical protein HKX48_002120 [Thoreauomyces humboldtii]